MGIAITYSCGIEEEVLSILGIMTRLEKSHARPSRKMWKSTTHSTHSLDSLTRIEIQVSLSTREVPPSSALWVVSCSGSSKLLSTSQERTFFTAEDFSYLKSYCPLLMSLLPIEVLVSLLFDVA
jgi:hypothetical protein